MGYDLHITRAVPWCRYRRYPILPGEVLDLVQREPDLTIAPGDDVHSDHFLILVGADNWLRFNCGELKTKHPTDPLIRRMIEIAAGLDAWVLGDDGEKYHRDGHEVISQQPDLADLPLPAYFLTRHRIPGGMNWDRPILEREWIDLVASQPDFTVLTRVEAKLPSGLRWIACPPVAYWTAHPSGKPVPFFFDDDLIEVANPDPATVQRMLVLATALAAKVMDEDDNHITA